ncbi:MAG: tape measure protein, partial [Eubacterium sp.]
MADGRLIIDTGVDNAGAEQGLKKTEKLADQSVSKIESSLKDISKIKASPKIIADTASADANLARLKAQTKSIEDKKVAATIDASTGNFDSKYSRIKLNLENFTKEKVSPNISANTVDADAKLARMRAQFTALGKVKVKPSVNADTTDATAKTSKIKSLLQSISDKAHKVTVWAETSSAEKGLISIKEKSKLATIGIKEIVGALGLVQIASSAINAIAQSMDGAISRFDIMKKYPKVMESLGINAEDSTKSIKKLSDGIDGLPTTLDDVVSSAQRITSITGNIEKSTDATIALNNAFLASGSSTEDASRGMQQYIQMLSRGKVDMESWQTLQETMPVALQKVAESFGLVGESAQTDLYDKLKEGEITFAEFQDKLIELGTGTGMLAELARVNSEGIATSFQNLKTAVVKGLEGILQKVNDTLRSLTGKNIADYINGFKTQLNAFFDTVGNLAASSIPYILNFLKTLEKIAPIAASVLSGIIAYKSAMTIVSIIGKVASAFSFFANVLGSIGSISGLFAGITAVIGPIGWIALAIGAVTSALVYFWNTNEDFRNFVISAWDNIKNAIVGAWESIQPALATGWEIIKSTVSGGVSVIQDSWGGACALMKGDFDGFKDHIENSAKTIRETGKKIFDSLPESAQDNVRKASDKLKEIGKDFIAKTQPSFDKIKAVFGKIIDTVKPVFEQISRLMTEKIIPALKGTSDQAEATGMGMSEGMKPAFSVLNDLIIPAIEIFANVLAWAVNFITPILMAIGNLVAVVSNVVGFITAIFNGDWAAAWGFAGGIVDGFKNIVVNVLDFILQIFGTSCADITTKLSGAVSTIQGILTTLSTIFSNVFSLIHGIVTGNQEQTKQAMLNIWNALPSPIQGVLTNITNIISGKLNEALAFVRGLKDKMLSAGRDMMNGLADGIKDAINAPIDWIRQAADNIKSAFDAKFDINSPSKWGFGRGAFVMQGVVNGLKSIDLTGYFNSVIDRIKDKFTSGTLNIST